jgi:hypothetical protein
MSATLKTARHPTAPTVPQPVTPAPRAYRPDVWALWFWLSCAALLILLHLSEALGPLFRALFRRG